MRHRVTLLLGLAALSACVGPDKQASPFGVGATDGTPPANGTITGAQPAGTATSATTDLESDSGSTADPSTSDAPTTGAATTSGAAPPDLPLPDPTTDTTATGSSGGDSLDPVGEGEGQLCFNADDCPDAAPYCGDNECHDGDEGDACDDDDDCGEATPSCVANVCHDGNEGDPCKNDFDCGPFSPVCVASQCWDGQEGDPCMNHNDCAPFFGCKGGACTDDGP
ncbi:hypothetical protein [Nannocystis sp. SCPEA4]|uniref:hypothetical protein n=1 Tax=Nannocystis sp. SCPEA4 TaxID=2996787 RepID=UPI00226E309A|nr:hypothetical protein [Nannocystis sp. SCPEA4]MCY1058766.1 hypothetical protein [Nannocystis sp. SCPEA4]